MQQILFSYPNLNVRAGSVFDLVFDDTASAAEGYSPEKMHPASLGVKGIKLGMMLYTRNFITYR
jgi:hypothetical protein